MTRADDRTSAIERTMTSRTQDPRTEDEGPHGADTAPRPDGGGPGHTLGTGTSRRLGDVVFKNLAVGIVALDDDLNTWIVGQYRYPLGVYSWEIPEGGGKREARPVRLAVRRRTLKTME